VLFHVLGPVAIGHVYTCSGELPMHVYYYTTVVANSYKTSYTQPKYKNHTNRIRIEQVLLFN
jgi:hypothetical protein